MANSANQKLNNNSSASNESLLNFSNQIFNVRRMLIEQFNRIEKDLQSKFNNNQEKFATKEELYSVIGKMQEFRHEIEKTLSLHEELSEETVAEDLFTGLNPFNLRKKYHELSLKLRSEEVDPFGYDPIFKPNGYDQCFAEMSLSEKSQISHRGIAVAKLAAFINNS